MFKNIKGYMDKFLKERKLRKIRRKVVFSGNYNNSNLPKILITGGLGFIFSHVTEYYVKKGWRVVVLDNMTEGSVKDIIDSSFTFYNIHAADIETIDILLHEKPDYIIHAGAISDVDYSVREPYRTIRKNTLGSLHVFEACRQLSGLKKVVYVSTDEVYGECEFKMKESDTLYPKNPYSCSKANGSLMRIAYENTHSSLAGKTAETRFCNVFGPRQDPRKIFAILKNSIKTGKSVPIHNGGKGYREYIYVKNIPSAVDLILEKGRGVYNLTLNDGFTVEELVKKVEMITNKKISLHESNRPGMDMKYQMDSSKIRALGWEPSYSFEDGINEYFSSDQSV